MIFNPALGLPHCNKRFSSSLRFSSGSTGKMAVKTECVCVCMCMWSAILASAFPDCPGILN